MPDSKDIPLAGVRENAPPPSSTSFTLDYNRALPQKPISIDGIYRSIHRGFIAGSILCGLAMIPIVFVAGFEVAPVAAYAALGTLISSAVLQLTHGVFGRRRHIYMAPGELWYSVVAGAINNLIGYALFRILMTRNVLHHIGPVAGPMQALFAVPTVCTIIAACLLLPRSRKKQHERHQ